MLSSEKLCSGPHTWSLNFEDSRAGRGEAAASSGDAEAWRWWEPGRGWFGGGARIKASVSAGLDLRGGEEVGWKHALEDGVRETEEGGRENDTGRTGETDRNGWDRRRTAVCQRKRLPLRAGRGAVALLAGTRPGSAP